MRAVVRRQMPLPEIEGDTDAPFAVTFKDIEGMPCDDLETLFIEIRDYRVKIAQAGFRGAREVSLIILRGSNFNAEVDPVLDFLRTEQAFIEAELRRKCGRVPP